MSDTVITQMVFSLKAIALSPEEESMSEKTDSNDYIYMCISNIYNQHYH